MYTGRLFYFVERTITFQVIHSNMAAIPVSSYHGNKREPKTAKCKLHRPTSRKRTSHEAINNQSSEFIPATQLGACRIHHHPHRCHIINIKFPLFLFKYFSLFLNGPKLSPLAHSTSHESLILQGKFTQQRHIETETKTIVRLCNTMNKVN